MCILAILLCSKCCPIIADYFKATLLLSSPSIRSMTFLICCSRSASTGLLVLFPSPELSPVMRLRAARWAVFSAGLGGDRHVGATRLFLPSSSS